MILLNKFVRIYSYQPRLIFTIFVNLVLVLNKEESVDAKTTPLARNRCRNLTDFNNTQSEEGAVGGRAEIFVAIVYPKSKENVFSGVIKQTVASLFEDFTTATNLRVVPQYTAIGDTEGYKTDEVEQVCTSWNRKPIIAVIVFGSFKSGFGHVLTSLHNNVPVLWATGEVQPGYFERVPLSKFEVRLDPGSYEVLRSLRSLLLATHWHAFTIVHTTSLLASRAYKDIINQPPLLPTILQFRPDSTSYYIFRLLTDVSKSTKGVIVLVCEGNDAKRVMQESKKLNMLNGDFVWLWIDTGAMLIDDSFTKLKIIKESNYVVEMRRVRHAPIMQESNTSVDYTTCNGGNSSSDGSNVKIARPADNNNTNISNTTIRDTADRSRTYENKTDRNLYDNDINTNTNTSISGISSSSSTDNDNTINNNNNINNNLINNRILPSSSSSASSSSSYTASFSALEKHHFALYRMNKNWRIAKKEKVKEKNEQRIKFKKVMAAAAPFLPSAPNQDNNFTGTSSSFWANNEETMANRMVVERMLFSDSSRRRRMADTSDASATVRKREYVSFEVPVFDDNITTLPVVRSRSMPEMPVGVLALQLMPFKIDKNYVKSSLRVLVSTLKDVIVKYGDAKLSKLLDLPRISCFDFLPLAHNRHSIIEDLTRNLKIAVKGALAGRVKLNESHFEESWNSSLAAKFKIMNLVPEENLVHNKSGLYLKKLNKVNTTMESRNWHTIGSMVGEESVHLETIVWPGGDIIPVSTGRGSRSIFRIVTAFAPPFVMIGEVDEDGQCLRGIECHQFLTSDKDNLTLLFNEIERTEEESEVNVLDRIQLEKSKELFPEGMDHIRSHHFGHKFKTSCCYGLSMDLLENVAEELEFDFQLYIVADGLFGSKIITERGESKWNGIIGDLVSGAAHMSFSALSVSSSRAQAIDFSVPYFFSGVSFLAAPKESTDIPLLAFLVPFSPNLWIAIAISLHVTAIAVASYEWLSPFGLNPWGRQRSKNFGIASALWVTWGLLCGHTLQFKAPKSWPNKFLINVWGGFSVIFIASYTANIAALIAGLFFHTAVGDHHDRSLLTQRVGAPKASAAEYYVRSTNQMLWDHMQRYSVMSVAEGVQLLKNNSLDILIADTPILDYYRATDHGCKLQKVGDTINEDTYAIGMMKGFPLKDSISSVIAKYASNGYTDILQEKWYGGLPCFKLATDMAQPRPLGVAAVAGVFLMLGLGVVIGCLILLSEHLFYKYTLPSLRKKPKSSIWKSRNVMFFSQKLYRFINCVELVSPHHAARELVNTLRQGQITSLFQKSVRRKEHEQRQQQQKSKAQFFEMIQEIRRVQQESRKCSRNIEVKISPRKKYYTKNQQIHLSSPGMMKHRSKLSPGRLDFARRLSKDVFRSRSSGNLDIARTGSDINMATGRFIDYNGAQSIGRRLSHGACDNSPPDINTRRASQFLREDNLYQQSSASSSELHVDMVDRKQMTSATSDTEMVIKSPPPLMSPRRVSASIFSRDIGPMAARKFSNVDSPSFRGIKPKLQQKLCAPKLTVNNEDFIESEGCYCGEHTFKTPNGLHRCSPVKTTEHIIEIVIPSDSANNGMSSDLQSPLEVCGHHHSIENSEAEKIGDDTPSNIDEQLYESKPKIILHLPKKKTTKMGSTPTNEKTPKIATPFQRLSVDELRTLSELSEKELKDRLLKVLEEKNPT